MKESVLPRLVGHYGIPALVALVVGLVLSWSVTLALGYLLIRHTPLAQIESRTDPRTKEVFTRVSLSEQDGEFLRNEIARAGIVNGGDEATVLAVLKWTMNQVQHVSPNDTSRARQVLEMARQGEGFLCGGMAVLFHQALHSLNIRARLVYLQRNIFDVEDTHVTVEAWIDGSWRVYDPTFHVVLVRNGTRVGVSEAYEWFIRRKGAPVTFEFLGDVKYPARLDKYYVRFEALLNNVFVALDHPSSRARLIPIVGPIWAPSWVPIGDEVGDNGYLWSYQVLYVIGLVVLPITSLLLLLHVVVVLMRACATR